MKRTFITLSLLSLLTLGYSQNYGFACEDAIHVGYNYMGTVAQGTYWFTSNTNNLPLTLYYIPDNEYMQEPEIWLDFTCVEGYYDDPTVENMIRKATNYDLSFPMKEKLEETEYDGKFAYRVHFNESYRDMLYGQGVTYPIDAFVKIVSAGRATVKIQSESVHQECAAQSMELKMNSTLNVVAADSTNVFLFPIGEWIEQDYQVSWTGSPATIYLGQDCQVESTRRVWKKLTFKNESTLIFDKDETTKWIKDAYTPELYMRIYSTGDGALTITPYSISEYMQSYHIAGTYAIIDNENLTITAILPKGTNLSSAISNAQCQPAVSPITGDAPKLINRGTQLRFGNIVYKLNITVAADDKSHDASLRHILFDGEPFEAFIPSQTNYDSVGVEYEGAEITVMTNNSKAKAEIKGSTDILPSTVTITVTAEAGNHQTYTLNLVRSLSKDASIYSIRINGEPLASFSPDVHVYRMNVLGIPKVRAIANDKNARVSISQARSVPGVARIRVTAEAGNVAYYSIIIDKDPRLDECSFTTETIRLEEEKAISKQQSAVYALAVKEIAGKNLMFSWTGQQPLQIALSAACQDETNAVFTQLSIQKEKGQAHYAKYVLNDSVAQWTKQSIDGNIYLHILSDEDAKVSIRPFERTCFAAGTLIDLPSLTSIQENSFNRIYKFYLPDWQKKDVEITWNGGSTLELFIADTCDFLLLPSNIHLLSNGYHTLSSGQSFTVTQAQTTSWLANSDEFAYVRVLNGAAGTLTLKVAKDNSGEEPPAKKQYTLTLNTTPENAGVFEVNGEANTVYSFDEGTNATVRAIANEHYTFRSWADGNTQNPRTITMNQDREMTAVFVADKYTLTVTCDATMGRVSGTGRYTYLAEAKIEARAHTGYEFVEWKGADTSWRTENPAMVVVTGDMSIEAIFQKIGAGVENIEGTHSSPNAAVRKVLIDGTLYILMPDGNLYTTTGQLIEE